uniref:Kinesin motor domain-containing protein n=1 Tax=Astatotilapia calliptera TaxID=8154 RepID=A0A3P8N9Y9_ASTCA
MMESCPDKADKQEQVAADVLKGAHLSEVGTLPDSQDSCTEEKEHLQVYLRVRPFTSAETNSGESQDCVTIKLPDTVLLKPPSSSLSARLSTDKAFPQTGQHFQFSQVYGPETTQRELFAGTVKDLVKDVLEGRNSLVFTYGVTNAGKTFTFLGPDSDAGILPRSLDVIFSSINEKVFPGMSIKPHRCREFTRLTVEQQTEEALFKRSLLRQLKEVMCVCVCACVCVCTSMLWTNAEDEISLEVEANTKFSVWVSFCEIYNENIHDLLEVAPGGALRRTALRLSQDVKGNAFVKDLRWVQVNSAEEAYMVMKLGKKNQSFSSTRLNHLSSRSHSIFSIRILRIEDVGTPRVQTVSELCLCDLAGSERCAKTHNKGERLKEAGNINTSLLILGKCINALRHNQQAKLLQHVPFRESKLTHYLQSFFCGRGKACMIININQCASMYDETLNVLKFSAVAQKVVVLSSKPVPFMPQRSVGEVSFIMNSTESKALRSSRTSSLMGFESSLEDVQEDEDDDTKAHVMFCCFVPQRQAVLLNHLQVQLKKARAESLLMESRVREDIGREFSELFSEMQNDYNERLAREREILEERAERRLEIFKNLINKMAAGPSGEAEAVVTQTFIYVLQSPSVIVVFTSLFCVTSNAERAEKAFVQLQAAQAQVDEQAKAIQEKCSQIQTLTQEADRLKQEVHTSAVSQGANEKLQEEVSQFQKSLAEERQKTEAKHKEVLDLEHELAEVKQQLAHKQLVLDQQLELSSQKEASSKQEVEELQNKLKQQGEMSQAPLDDLQTQLECQKQDSREEAEELRGKLEQQTAASERQVEQLKERLREQEASSLQQLEELKRRLSEQKSNSSKLVDDLRQKLSEQERAAERLKTEVEDARIHSEAKELKRMNSDLQAEAASLREKVSNMEKQKESCKTEAQPSSSETERMLEEKDSQMEEKLAELQKELLEKDAQVTSLKKSLQEAQEQREEDECQAVQEARRKEVERRRELLAVAHEAIAQKEVELKKRDEDISSPHVVPQVSSGCPSVLESSEISTEEGRMSRFPRPELEISFSPLQPNRMALRRQGEEGAVTVKITRSARKRKSGEMEKEVEAENRRNTRTKLTPNSSPAGRHDSQISVRSRKEGTLQKIGDFLQSSPTLLGTKGQHTIVGLKNVLYFEHKTEQQKPMLRLTKSALNEFSVLHKSHVYRKCRNLKCSGPFLQRGKLRSQQSKSV